MQHIINEDIDKGNDIDKKNHIVFINFTNFRSPINSFDLINKVNLI